MCPFKALWTNHHITRLTVLSATPVNAWPFFQVGMLSTVPVQYPVLCAPSAATPRRIQRILYRDDLIGAKHPRFDCPLSTRHLVIDTPPAKGNPEACHLCVAYIMVITDVPCTTVDFDHAL